MRIIRKIKNRIREMVQQHHKRKLHSRQIREGWAFKARQIAEILVRTAQEQSLGTSTLLTSDWVDIRLSDFFDLPEAVIERMIGKELSKVTKSHSLTWRKPTSKANMHIWQQIRADIILL